MTIAEDIFGLFDEPPVTVMIPFKGDPIAAACCGYREFIEKKQLYRWASLEDLVPTDEDNAKAFEIRNYYSRRYTFEALKSNTPVSSYRKKVNALLGHENIVTRESPQSDMGILYRLPYFYAEDTGLDFVIEATKSASMSDSGTSQPELVDTFYPLARILHSRKFNEQVQFWFTCDSNESPYVIIVDFDSGLLALMDKLFTRDSIRFSGSAECKEHRGRHQGKAFWQLLNPVLA